MNDTGTVTQMLRGARGGDRAALDQLFALLYDELRGIARARLRVAKRWPPTAIPAPRLPGARRDRPR